MKYLALVLLVLCGCKQAHHSVANVYCSDMQVIVRTDKETDVAKEADVWCDGRKIVTGGLAEITVVPVEYTQE